MYKLALVVLLSLLVPQPILACSCVRTGSHESQVRQEFKESEAVFSAYVASVDYAEVDGTRTRVLKLRVMQVWKGDLQPNTWLNVISDDNLGLIGCSYIAGQNDALLIYTSGKQPYFLTSCSLTSQLDQATQDIPLLNKLSNNGR